jgi:hypothetical protein
MHQHTCTLTTHSSEHTQYLDKSHTLYLSAHASWDGRASVKLTRADSQSGNHLLPCMLLTLTLLVVEVSGSNSWQELAIVYAWPSRRNITCAAQRPAPCTLTHNMIGARNSPPRCIVTICDAQSVRYSAARFSHLSPIMIDKE